MKKYTYKDEYHDVFLSYEYSTNIYTYILHLNIFYKTQEEQYKKISLCYNDINHNTIILLFNILTDYLKKIFYNLKCKSRYDEKDLNLDLIKKINLSFIIHYVNNKKFLNWKHEKNYKLNELFSILDL